MPLTSSAAGIGIYMVNVMNERELEGDQAFGYSPGMGLSFDTNLGKNKVFGYRLNFEYYRASGTDIPTYYNYNGVLRPNREVDVSKNVFSIVNNINFGMYRSEHLRIWLGVSIGIQNIDYTSDNKVSSDPNDLYYDENYYNSLNLEIGPVVGLNYNINESTSLGVDLSYGVLNFGTTSAKARVYAFWRFGETFVQKKPTLVIDQPKEEKQRDFESKLNYLKSLREKEIITEDEYQEKRQEVIKSLKL